jgi:hypothetical protein
MPPTKRPAGSATRPPEGAPEALQEMLKTLVALQASAQASQQHVRESSEALIEANRSNLEQLAERVVEATERTARELADAMRERKPERVEVVLEQPARADDAVTREQRLRQRQLVLTYDAFRTMLGRAPTSGAPGAAAVFMAVRVNADGQRDDDADSILISGPAPFAVVEAGWTLVAITSTNQTLRAELERHGLPYRVQMEHLAARIDIRRLEIRDASDDPIYLGVGPATQTDNSERHRGAHRAATDQPGEGEDAQDPQGLYNRIPVDRGTR